MSVINEALKRAREFSQKPGSPANRPGKTTLDFSSKAWILAWIAVFIAGASLYYREFQSHQKTQTKLQQALLKLNDARGEAMQAYGLVAKKQVLEYDNLEKEKKISELSKQLHELKMDKLQSTQSKA